MEAMTAALPMLEMSTDPAASATATAVEALIDRPEWQADWEAEFSAWLSTQPAEPPLPPAGGVARFCGDPLGPDLASSDAPSVSADAEDPSTAADRLVSAIVAAKQDECLAVWRQLEAMADLLRLWGTRSADAEDEDFTAEAVAAPGSGGRRANSNTRRLDLDELAPMCVVTEVALACGTSEYAVGRRLDAAMALIAEERLPRTAALASVGALDWPKLQAVVRETSALTPAAAAAVEAAVVERLPDLNVPRLTTALREAVAVVDRPAHEDRTELARAQRCVITRGAGEGMGEIQTFAPVEAVAAVAAALDLAVKEADAQGDSRTPGQVRSDTLVSRVTGLAHFGGVMIEDPAGGPGPSNAGPNSARRNSAGQNSARRNSARRNSARRNSARGNSITSTGSRPVGSWPSDARAAVTAVPQEVPGSRPGSGAVEGTPGDRPPSRWASPRLSVVVTVPFSTWAGFRDDPATLDGYGPITADAARALIAGMASTATWRCAVVDDHHGTLLGLGRPTHTKAYVPPSRLADFVRTLHPLCTVSGCGVRAARCDLDHQTPYPDGPTCECNLAPLCRRHHNLKTAGHLTVAVATEPGAPPGARTWTTRAGRRSTHVSPALTPSAGQPGSATRVPCSPTQESGGVGTRTGTSPPASTLPDDPPF